MTYLVNKDATDLSLLLKEMPPVGTLLASGVWGTGRSPLCEFPDPSPVSEKDKDPRRTP